MIKKTNPKELLLFKNIGVFMKETRLENKKTQSYVANLLSCTFQQVQKYEKATNFIGLFKLETFCERFGKDIGKVVSDAKDNLFLPEKLIEEGKIKTDLFDPGQKLQTYLPNLFYAIDLRKLGAN